MIAQVSRLFTRVFGSRNERMVKAYMRRVQQINALEPQMAALTDTQLREKTQEYQKRFQQGEKISSLLPEIMATAREIMDRSVGIRSIFNPAMNFDPSQLPAELQPVYHEVAAKAQALEPQPVLGGEPAPGWMQVEIPNSIYEAVRKLYPQSRPPFRARPFDVQLIGGMVLGEGKIAEMKTGEGKTIVAPLACYVACIEGLQCHVVTVNDYLVQRDRDWVFPFYYHAGLTVGAIHPYHMQPPQLKAQAYQCNVVYGTNSEFGFDYLRDNMKLSTLEQVQKRRDFCIVDEIDSILIDEARTPLIISGPAHEDAPRYELADQLARHLIQKQQAWDAADRKVEQCMMRIKGLEGDIRNARDKSKIPALREEMERLKRELPILEAERDKHTQYYEVEREKKAAHLTHEGVAEAQKVAGIGSFYVGNNMDLPHLLENALRAHVVYQRDKDYVVQNGEVIIVDEFTGRLMIGRQWSDGLHQAVEAKEKVKIKEETQTLATVTIQNFFKLYKRLAGMTGTAITEATEFHEIYKLDVVCIPTNLPVVRIDRDDLVFLSAKDKWNAILDEIKRIHDTGRPVLVGTTSVEKSEMLSRMLQAKYNIRHEVLNAKQHEREAHIVEHAGELGAVMIATNMAGRGTDIKLAPIKREDLVRHWQLRNLLPARAKPEMSDEELISLAYRHQLHVATGAKEKEIETLSDDEVKLRLMRHWVTQHAYYDAEKAKSLSAEQCMNILDKVPDFLLHRLQIFTHVEQMGGLHIVGTERHESRRIDNQLRGRAGRQGDRGSSRFFISLEDDLMKLFAGKTTMAALSKLGMKEGDAIEHRWITRSVERAQRKVEERNYEIRKNLLEYDEVMEHQRNTFYGIRQNVLEGRDIERLIFDYITESVQDAVDLYLDKEYVQTQIAEWCRQTLDVSIEATRLRLGEAEDVIQQIRAFAHDEVRTVIDTTLGEYMSNDMPPEEWDLRGLSAWAKSRFDVDLQQNQLRQMSVDEVRSRLIEAALEQIDRKDLSGVQKFLNTLYGQTDLAQWVKQKFDVEMSAEEIAKFQTRQEVMKAILDRAREVYRKREITYPVDFVLEMAVAAAQQNGPWAAQQLCLWAKQRYELDWQPEQIARMTLQELRSILINASEQWMQGGKLEKLVDEALSRHRHTVDELAKWATERFLRPVTVEELQDESKRRDVLLARGRSFLRTELTQLERFVLLQILDQAWKDHLYSMDQLKDSVGLRGYAERDPRIEYKREGARQFAAMQQAVRDRVTDLIFRAKLTPNVQVRNVYHATEARHDEAGSAVAAASKQAAPAAAAGGAAAQGSDEQRADLEAAERAGSDAAAHLSRRQRRARAARAKDDDAATGPRHKQRKRKRK